MAIGLIERPFGKLPRFLYGDTKIIQCFEADNARRFLYITAGLTMNNSNLCLQFYLGREAKFLRPAYRSANCNNGNGPLGSTGTRTRDGRPLYMTANNTNPNLLDREHQHLVMVPTDLNENFRPPAVFVSSSTRGDNRGECCQFYTLAIILISVLDDVYSFGAIDARSKLASQTQAYESPAQVYQTVMGLSAFNCCPDRSPSSIACPLVQLDCSAENPGLSGAVGDDPDLCGRCKEFSDDPLLLGNLDRGNALCCIGFETLRLVRFYCLDL